MMTKEELATHRAIQRLEQKIPELSLRDLFALSALNGLMSRVNVNDDTEKQAEKCYRIADAMLKAREKKE